MYPVTYSTTLGSITGISNSVLNGTLDFNTPRDLGNFCRNGKWLEIPYVQAFFTLCSPPSLCEYCSTSQILLADSGPHPPNTMSPDSCSDFASSFDPFNHSPPPSLQILLQPLQIQFHNLHLMPPPPSLLLSFLLLQPFSFFFFCSSYI